MFPYDPAQVSISPWSFIKSAIRVLTRNSASYAYEFCSFEVQVKGIQTHSGRQYGVLGLCGHGLVSSRAPLLNCSI